MSSLGPDAQALLKAGRTALRPTTDDRERIAAALRVRLGDTALTPDAQASNVHASPTTATQTLGWPAVTAVVVGLAVSGAALLYAFRAPEPTASTVAVVAPSSSPLAVVPPAAALAPEPAVAVQPLPPVESPALVSSPRRPADRLAEEVAILSRAETELHAGRYSGALRVLDEHERKFPRGTLAQERVAARIRALCGLGRNAEANAALARLSPGSLHEGPAREACAATSKK